MASKKQNPTSAKQPKETDEQTADLVNNTPPQLSKPQEQQSETVEVLALVANNTYGLKCGKVYSLAIEVAEQLIAAGVVERTHASTD